MLVAIKQRSPRASPCMDSPRYALDCMQRVVESTLLCTIVDTRFLVTLVANHPFLLSIFFE
jgi:hypothetical protein